MSGHFCDQPGILVCLPLRVNLLLDLWTLTLVTCVRTRLAMCMTLHCIVTCTMTTTYFTLSKVDKIESLDSCIFVIRGRGEILVHTMQPIEIDMRFWGLRKVSVCSVWAFLPLVILLSVANCSILSSSEHALFIR